MYKIFVNKTFIYSNVIIEKFITINSPWIPRIGETISTISIQGKIKELTNGYGDNQVCLSPWKSTKPYLTVVV